MFFIRNRRRPAPSTSRRARPHLETLEDRTTPAHLFVNTLSQTIDPTDNLLSLREAIAAVNSGNLSQLSTAEKGQVATAEGQLGTNDTIKFQVTGTIGLNQELTLSRDVTIRGPGGTSLTVSGQGVCRVFTVGAGVHATISDLAIANGKGIDGGGILNDGTLELTNCTLSGNSASFGGGIYNSGTLALANCTLSGNSATSNGGGIFNDDTLELANCTLSSNSASRDGGGIYANNYSVTTLDNCTLSGNSAREVGGGIYNSGTLELANCTLSSNSASYGGGIYSYGGGIGNYGAMTLTNCTLSGNSAVYGGGIGNYDGSTATLINCTLSSNSAYSYGGGIYSYGPLAMINCTLSGASASSGGGIWNDGTLTLTS